MSEKLYEEAWNFTIEELKKSYIAQNRENEFIFNFNMKYVEDSGDEITISVANEFLKQMMTKKGSFEIVQNKIRETTGLNTLTLKCIIRPNENQNQDSQSNSTSQQNSISSSSNSNGTSSSAENNSYSLNTTNSQITFSESSSSQEQKSVPKKQHSQLKEELNFDTFIPGENSSFAYNASIAVAKEPGKKYNPILLYGGSGLGKTHLMQAIGNYIYNNNPEKLKICYVSAESFTNEFILSLREKTDKAFKNKYRNLDVLLLDDIHFLQGKDSTQEELFYTFDALSQKKAQMVFTCDRPIREIKTMAERLVSRISNGMCIDLQPPNYETRYAILQKKIELQNKFLEPEIIDYIAQNVETNVRELESALEKIFGYEELIGQKLTLEIVKNQLRDIISSNSAENISLDIIQKVIADNFQISVSDLKGKKRDKKFVVPRQIAIYISRELTEISYTELGNEFGGKDHSTIMHAYEKIAEQIKLDSILESKIQLYIRQIKDYKK
ncbi:MAG: chromosomal replication initiator protein DnaA [Treponema sp.]|nr:chromosomal replication initiator protein DnaA [Treponema sp.]